MSLKCFFGKHKWTLLDGKCLEKCTNCGKERNIEHNWYEDKCTRCGKIYSNEGLENHLASITNPINRAMTINALPQEALIYLAKNAHSSVIRENTIKLIKNKKIIVEIALADDNYSVRYGAVGSLSKRSDLEKFINDSDSSVSRRAKEEFEKSMKIYTDYKNGMTLEELRDKYKLIPEAIEDAISE